MKIISVTTTRYRYTTNVWRDLEGHPSVGKEHESQNTLLTVKADNGAEGYAFGGVSEEICKSVIEPAMVGEDAFDREKIWQRFRSATWSAELWPNASLCTGCCYSWRHR